MVYPTLTNVSHSITTMKVIMMNEEKKELLCAMPESVRVKQQRK